jgi:DNA-directed RNA polymerase specialized sigma24 family protein
VSAAGGADAQGRPKSWILTEAAFNRLLARLDSDRERAGEKYEQMRSKLNSFFRWRGCSNPEERTDQTLDRLARRIELGTDIHLENLAAYVHGVALNILREHWREQGKAAEGLSSLAVTIEASTYPQEQQEHEDAQAQSRRQLLCLERCMEALPLESRRLVVKYHSPEGARIAERKRLASALGLPLNTLRVRACRIRAALEACVENCMKAALDR